MILLQFTLLGRGGYDPGNLDIQTVTELIQQGIRLAASFIGIIVFIYLLVASFQYIMAGGNDAKQADAKRAIQAAIIGFIIVIASYTIVMFLLNRLGFNASIRNNTGIPAPSL